LESLDPDPHFDPDPRFFLYFFYFFHAKTLVFGEINPALNPDPNLDLHEKDVYPKPWFGHLGCKGVEKAGRVVARPRLAARLAKRQSTAALLCMIPPLT